MEEDIIHKIDKIRDMVLNLRNEWFDKYYNENDKVYFDKFNEITWELTTLKNRIKS